MHRPLVSIALALAAASAHAQIAKYAKDAPGTKEPPEIKRVEGSIVLHFTQKKFDEFVIPTGRVVFEYGPQKFNDWPRIRVEGSRTTLFFRQPKDATTLEVQRSYEDDLAGKGFEKIFAGSSNSEWESERNELDNGYGRFLAQVYTSEMDQDLQKYTMAAAKDFRYLAMKRPGSGGRGDLYVAVLSCAIPAQWKNEPMGILENTVVSRVDIVEAKPLETRMVLVKSGEMREQIEKGGRVALYGIFFDFNKATLQRESEPTLQEIAKLLEAEPDLKLLVVGHTDSVGEFEFNRDLSARRAAAVVEALAAKHSISKARLFPFGCSFASPAASNTTEEGRAKNRRVELVRWGQ